MVAEGRSPAQEKQREKRRLSDAQTFGGVGKRWFKEARMAESTHSMRKAIYDRDCQRRSKNASAAGVKVRHER
jgi:hypothetical protein